MMPVFANLAGFWALLGIPTILAIHLLQQKSRRVRTSTWFLIEHLAPDSTQGRTIDRIRSSWTLWCQLLAVLAITWVLVKPRWVRTESAQTVVFILDSSASMEAFRGDVTRAVEAEMSAADGLAAQTTWVVMTTDVRRPPLYRGAEREDATAAVAEWLPELGEHDRQPALRLARSLAGETGRTLFITDRKSRSMSGQRTAGVGRALENVGFAGASAGRANSGQWVAIVRNQTDAPQTRRWHVEAGAAKSAEQAVSLAPNALAEIRGSFPEGVTQISLVLSGDDFPLDDRLPLVRPMPKPLSVQVDGTDAAAGYFRRAIGLVDGVTLTEGSTAALRVARLGAAEMAAERRGGIFWPGANPQPPANFSADPVVAERAALVASLNWQGWLGPGPFGYTMVAGDEPLLWQGTRALAFYRPGGAHHKLLLAFDWDATNAARHQGLFLLVTRFIEEQRDRQRAPYAANFDSLGLVSLAGLRADEGITVELQPAAGGAPIVRQYTAAERHTLRAPGRPGLFTVKTGGELLVRGAAQFADSRQGDFKPAETFRIEQPLQEMAALERNTRADPFASFWLLLAGGLLFASWWPRRPRTAQASAPVASRKAYA